MSIPPMFMLLEDLAAAEDAIFVESWALVECVSIVETALISIRTMRTRVCMSAYRCRAQWSFRSLNADLPMLGYGWVMKYAEIRKQSFIRPA